MLVFHLCDDGKISISLKGVLATPQETNETVEWLNTDEEIQALLRAKFELGSLTAVPWDIGACGATRSSKWSEVRYSFLKTNPTCAACGGTSNLQVHHKKPFHLFPALELDPTNFITLCECPNRLCHIRVGHSWDWSMWNPNVVEDAALELKRKLERKSAT